jgi:hypothetical protein
MTREFAPDIPRTSEGWIDMPSDTQLRKNLFFPDEVMNHPAKMNLHMQMAVIDYVASPGETMMDPFGGTGSLMVAALHEVRVVLIEIEHGYHELQKKSVANLERWFPGKGQLVTLLQGDNRFLMPIPCDHVCTSPPYASAMKIKSVRDCDIDNAYIQKTKTSVRLSEWDKQMSEYCKSERNISNLNSFLYTRAMEKIYTLCYQSVRPGGTVTINTKDRIENGKRVYLSEWVCRVFKQLGAEQDSWHKFKAMGSGFTKIARSQGKNTVDQEDVIVFRKPL